MTRLLPLQAVFLFVLLFKWIHCLNITHSHWKRHSTTPTTAHLVGREDYTSFNETNDQQLKSREPTKTTNRPSVTTVIIIQTNGHTYHELGGGTGSNSDNGMTDPNDANIQAEIHQDNKEVKRMISIVTVVGGVGLCAIITGTLLFIRSKKRRQRTKSSRQSQHSSLDGSDNSTISIDTPTSQSQQYESRRSQQVIEISSSTPSAPLEPMIPPNHIPSLPSTVSIAPAPSAPSAKELEMNLLSSKPLLSLPFNQPSLSTSNHSPLDTTQTMTLSQSSSSSRHIPNLPTTRINGLKNTDQPLSTPELPPPAYTPSPLPVYILPPSQRRRSADQLSLDRYRR
ncbi:hypothetical protein BC941DRAFT_427077 [Chlamydoabsidia padenii]|nr:hypothetical protein BC941DRAFT_427077 [Chlamydoabsidia padenii]